ncbi:hypothetical protein [Reichenbachiella sp. MSK19-1]|uniref:hypothetical protein n=1 Tax=Reichenbachiella sp. MSK19-1 TaxID=1897631 RepID=UPI000E6BE806|nr:hypothetical protein [Reichenbachiella sp. MSK19-1]RJE74150.1 hypothetical protein BGP76_13230 [Reichenbachiella sp. MSK19-1]
MKTKLYILFIITITILSSCSESVSNDKLIGTWKVVDAKFVWKGASPNVIREAVEDAKTQTYHIYPDKTFKIDFGNGPQGDLKWKLDSKNDVLTTITVGISDPKLGQIKYKISDFGSNKMTLTSKSPGQRIELNFSRLE